MVWKKQASECGKSNWNLSRKSDNLVTRTPIPSATPSGGSVRVKNTFKNPSAK